MSRLRLAVLCDARDEGWPSMDLVGEMLISALEGPLANEVQLTAMRPSLPHLARRVPGLPHRLALNADRLAGRYFTLPLLTRRLRAHDAYHVVDHSYAHLVRALPKGRAGVYCHDADAFRSLFDPSERARRPAWFRALARRILSGLQRAAVVFHSTQAVREELVRHSLVDPTRLVHAPYGVAPEFTAEGTAPSPLTGRFLLHVGSAAPRKRLDLLLDLFARVRQSAPDLRLVQVGAAFTPALREQVHRLGLASALVQPPPLPRSELAALYRHATLVLLPSDSEGFGLPALEALACGAPVLASDLPVLREVAGGAALYAPPGDAQAWADQVLRLLEGRTSPPPRAQRLSQVQPFTWETHARTILRAYQRIQ